MRVNHSPITMLIASLVVLATLGPAVAAQPAADANTDQLASYSALNDHANASMNESLQVHMHVDEDDWTIDAAHEGEGTATVTVEAIEGSYEGEGTYEIDGEESVVLPVPDEPVTLRVTIETDHATHTLVVEFVEVPVPCTDGERTMLRPVLLSVEVTVDGEQVYVHEYAEAGVHPDLPEVACEHPNESVIDDLPEVNWSVEDGREAYNWTHEEARENYEESHNETRETYEDSRDEARERYEEAREGAREAYEDAWRQYQEASDFARQVAEDAENDAEMIREDAEEDAEMVREDAEEDAETVAEDATDTAEQVREDTEDLADDGDDGDDGDASAESETRANASVSADASASYDDGSAEANASADADASAHSRTTVDSSNTPGLTADVSAVTQLKAQFGGEASA